MIVQHTGKLTIKEIEKFSSEGEVLNNLWYGVLGRDFGIMWLQKLNDGSRISAYGFEFGKLFGKPNCHMQNYEGSPGAWIFHDTEYKIRWLTFSDAIRKSCFKGTSIELTYPKDITREDFLTAMRKFFAHFGYEPLNYHGYPVI